MFKIIKIKNLTNENMEIDIGGNKTIYFNHNDPSDLQVAEITEGEFRNIDTILFSRGYLGIVSSLEDKKKENEMNVFATFRDDKFTLANFFDICNRILAINMDNEICLTVSKHVMKYLLNNNFTDHFKDVSFIIGNRNLNALFNSITIEPKNRFRKSWFSDVPAPLSGEYYFKL